MKIIQKRLISRSFGLKSDHKFFTAKIFDKSDQGINQFTSIGQIGRSPNFPLPNETICGLLWIIGWLYYFNLFSATCHAVSLHQIHQDRYSWPFFLGLSGDAVLDPLPDFSYNKPNFTMMESKRPKPRQTFNQWFVENVTEAADVVDTTGIAKIFIEF